jgi:hypothetical protein
MTAIGTARRCMVEAFVRVVLGLLLIAHGLVHLLFGH